MSEEHETFQGACCCGAVRFQLSRAPLFVHCCHCTYCQRESGSAFAVNALIETAAVQLLSGQTEATLLPSNSGKGHKVMRCGHCKTALWSHYIGAGEALAFVRVGGLNQPQRLAPDIHIYTESKLPWVLLPEGIPAVPQYYRASQLWPAASLARRAELLAAKP